MNELFNFFKKRIPLLFLIVVVQLVLFHKANASSNTNALLNELLGSIDNRDEYVQKKWNKIHYLMNEIQASRNSENLKLEYEVTFKLYEEYQSFIYDSAFKYVRKLIRQAHQLKNIETINQAKIELGFTYLSSGLFKESIDSLLTIRANTLDLASRVDYYNVLSRAFFDLSTYHNDAYYSNLYTNRGLKIIDSAIHILADTTAQYWILVGIRNAQAKNFNDAVDAFNFLLSQFELSQHDYAIATSALGWAYNTLDRNNDGLDMFLRAAIADIKESTKETVAFRNLAMIYYRQEQLDLAYKFIIVALENATFYNARHRKMEVSEILPIIEGKRLTALEKQRKQLLNYGKITTILIVLVSLFLIVIYRQLKKLRTIKSILQATNNNLKKINDTLRETNKIKEEYIGYFFSINSEFIERLSNIQKTLNRKIISRQFDDLKNVISSSDLNKEREKLYVNFDKIFLKLFPNFIDEFNKLFGPEDKVIVEKDELLNTDLRIFALIRLGITDNEKIAQFLNYSVNTIYTYKTKLKHKTIVPRDQFDDHILAIRAVAL